MTDNASATFGRDAQKHAAMRTTPSGKRSDIIVVCTPTTTRQKESIYLADDSDSDLLRQQFQFQVIDRMHRMLSEQKLNADLCRLFSKESGVPCQIAEQVLYKGSEIKVLRYTVNKGVPELHGMFSTAFGTRDVPNMCAQYGIGAIILVDVAGTHSVLAEICKQLESGTQKSIELLDCPEVFPLDEEILDPGVFTHNAKPVTVAPARKFMLQNERGTILIPSLKGYFMSNTDVEFTTVVAALQSRGISVAGKGADELRALYAEIQSQEADAAADADQEPVDFGQALIDLAYPRFCYKALAREYDLKVSKRQEIPEIVAMIEQHRQDNNISPNQILSDFVPIVETRGTSPAGIMLLASFYSPQADDQETEAEDEVQEMPDYENENQDTSNQDLDDFDEDDEDDSDVPNIAFGAAATQGVDEYDGEDESEDWQDADGEDGEENTVTEPLEVDADATQYFYAEAPTHEQRIAAMLAVGITPANPDKRIAVMKEFSAVRAEFLADASADDVDQDAEPAQEPERAAGTQIVNLDTDPTPEQMESLRTSIESAEADAEADDVYEDEPDVVNGEDNAGDADYEAVAAALSDLPIEKLRMLASMFGISVQSIVDGIEPDEEDEDFSVEAGAIVDHLIERIEPDSVLEVAEMLEIELGIYETDTALYVGFAQAVAELETEDGPELPESDMAYVAQTTDSNIGRLVQVKSRAALTINFVLAENKDIAVHSNELSDIDGANYKFPFNAGTKGKPQGAMIAPAKALSDIIEETVDTGFLAPASGFQIDQYAPALANLMRERVANEIYAGRLAQDLDPDEYGIQVGDYDEETDEVQIIPMAELYDAHIVTDVVNESPNHYVQTHGVLNVVVPGFWGLTDGDRAAAMIEKAINAAQHIIGEYSSLDVNCAFTFNSIQLTTSDTLLAAFNLLRSQDGVQTLSQLDCFISPNCTAEEHAEMTGRTLDTMPVDLLNSNIPETFFTLGGDMALILPAPADEVEEDDEEESEE